MCARTILVAVAAALWARSAVGLPLPDSTVMCSEDAEIAAPKQKAVQAAAETFVEGVLGPDPGSAYDLLTAEAKALNTPEEFRARAVTMVSQVAPLTNVAVQHTYLIELSGNAPKFATCAGDLSRPDETSFVAVSSAKEQAHVIVGAKSRNNLLAFTLWLVPLNGAWLVQSYWMTLSTLGDKDSRQLRDLARAQRAKGHDFNAALLYAAARETANRGPNFQLGISRSISEEVSNLKLPPELVGSSPFSWKDGPTTYVVLRVGPIAVAEKLYVIIAHEVAPGQSDAQLDDLNKRLFRYVKGRFPEYSEVFAGLVGRATERGTGRGFGSVEELPSPH